MKHEPKYVIADLVVVAWKNVVHAFLAILSLWAIWSWLGFDVPWVKFNGYLLSRVTDLIGFPAAVALVSVCTCYHDRSGINDTVSLRDTRRHASFLALCLAAVPLWKAMLLTPVQFGLLLFLLIAVSMLVMALIGGMLLKDARRLILLPLLTLGYWTLLAGISVGFLPALLVGVAGVGGGLLPVAIYVASRSVCKVSNEAEIQELTIEQLLEKKLAPVEEPSATVRNVKVA